ncbi:MAG: hypothetical protein GY803_15770 [Chloroflexi bacterium]|nr:hypothetical protein [Chloroflexota bacterium]
MKLLITLIDWEYPANRAIPKPELIDLSVENALLGLVLTLANGVIVEMRVEAPSEEALNGVRNMITGTGGSKLVSLTAPETEELWLYQDGDECYLQGSDGYMFVNPIPQPAKFLQ